MHVQPGQPRWARPLTQLLLGLVVLLASACTYALEEQRVVIEQVVRVGESYHGLVTVRYERFQRPTGLAAFPDGGKVRVHEQVATLYLIDAFSRSFSLLTSQPAPDSLWESFGAQVAGLDADSVAYFRMTGCPRNGECYPPLQNIRILRVTMNGQVQASERVPDNATLPGVMLARRPGEDRFVRFSTDGNVVTARFEEGGPFEPLFVVQNDGSLAVVGD